MFDFKYKTEALNNMCLNFGIKRRKVKSCFGLLTRYETDKELYKRFKQYIKFNSYHPTYYDIVCLAKRYKVKIIKHKTECYGKLYLTCIYLSKKKFEQFKKELKDHVLIGTIYYVNGEPITI